MPYQLNGQFVPKKSQRLLHATGAAAAAAGGGAFVAISAAVAALHGAAMSNAEATRLSEVPFMVIPI